jgi:deoxycytidine triphosphate deaminase
MPSVHQKRRILLEDLRKLTPLEDMPSELLPGVLYSNWIRYFCDEKNVPSESRLIHVFDEDKMHCAGYKLSVGDEYYLGDRHYCLPSYEYAPKSETSDWLEIPPFQVAVVKTQEVLCIPRFLIARWNLVVKLAYKGLLWVGAAQVDPGYVGHPFLPHIQFVGSAGEIR